MEKLPEHHKKKVLTVYRWVAGKDAALPESAKDLTWIPRNVDAIQAKIDTYQKLNTQKTYCAWLTTVFRILGETELHEKYKKIITQQQRTVNEEKMNSSLSKREKALYRTWPEIMQFSDKTAAKY